MTTRQEVGGKWDHRSSHAGGIDERITIAALASIRHRVDEIILAHQDALEKLGDRKSRK